MLIVRKEQSNNSRGYYIVDASNGYDYLHKDETIRFGIRDKELAFWETEQEANDFLKMYKDNNK